MQQISDRTLQLVEVRDCVLEKLKHTGRMLKRLVADPLESIAGVAKEAKQGWLQCVISDSEAHTISSAFTAALNIRDEREATEAVLRETSKAVKLCLKQDRAN